VGDFKGCWTNGKDYFRLDGSCTVEQKVYERQVAKQATAKRVIDEQQISRHYNQTDLMELYSYELQPTTEREMPILPKDRLFAEILTEHDKLIFKYHEHDSLLEQEEHENLSEELEACQPAQAKARPEAQENEHRLRRGGHHLQEEQAEALQKRK